MFPPTQFVEPNSFVESEVVALGGSGLIQVLGIVGFGGPRLRTCTTVTCSTVNTDWSTTASAPDDLFIQLNGQAAASPHATRTMDVSVGNTSTSWTITNGIGVKFLADAQSLQDLYSYSFTSLPLGTPDPVRRIVLAVHASTNASLVIEEGKLNGAPCTKVVAVHENAGNGSPGAMFLCDADGGSTGDVEVNIGGARPVRLGVALWSLVGMNQPADLDSTIYDDVDPGAVTLRAKAGGVVLVGVTQNNATGATITWNATERYSRVMLEGTDTIMAGAYHYARADGPVTITADSTGAAASSRMFAVSFR